jgi:hypothetical protein
MLGRLRLAKKSNADSPAQTDTEELFILIDPYGPSDPRDPRSDILVAQADAD